jgi:hypothetical protein
MKLLRIFTPGSITLNQKNHIHYKGKIMIPATVMTLFAARA